MKKPLLFLVLSFMLCNTSFSKTYKQVHAKKYFDTIGNGKISGKPTNYLYSGMNVVSYFGDLENSGNRRIIIRENTLAKYGDKWTKERRNNFKSITQKFKIEAKDYKKDLMKPHTFVKGIKITGRPGTGGKKNKGLK